MIFGDLHFHTTDSDGSKTNSERIEQIVQLDPSLQGIYAVTNHDMYSPGFVLPAREQGMQTVWATEISARSQEWDHSFHVTCYSPNLSEKIANLVSSILIGKATKVQSQIDRLASLGFPIDQENFFEWISREGFSETNISNAHLTDYLWNNKETRVLVSSLTCGEVDSSKKFLHECLKTSGKFREIGYVEVSPYEPDIEQLVEIAQSEGSILSIAHPNFSFTKFARSKFNAEPFESSVCEVFEHKIVPYFLERGIKNFEINASASPEWVGVIKDTVNRSGGLITFGSDNHGAIHATDTHGCLGIQNPLLTVDMIRYTKEKLLEFT